MCDVKKTGGKRITSSVDIESGERQIINEFAGKYGGKGTQKRVLTLLIQWFAKQPDSVKQAVLGWGADDLRHQQARIFRQLAEQLEADELEGSGAADTRGNRITFPPKVSR